MATQAESLPKADPKASPQDASQERIELLDALAKTVAILEQLQERRDQANEIISQGYFGHALVRGRRLLAQARNKEGA